MIKAVKKHIKKAINHLGFDLSRFDRRSSIGLRFLQLIRDYQIDTVLDIGANVGQYAKLMRKYGFKGRIISFEPLSDAHVKLVKNSRKDHGWIVAPRMALGNKDGKSRINISANCSSSSVLDMLDAHVDGAPESVYINSEEVRIAKLDTIDCDYIGKENNIFLKIDVQGFEYQVLEGAKKTLLSVQGMEVELSLTPLYDGQMLFRDMLEYISLLGFELIDILPEFRHQKTGRLLQVNGLFFRPV